MKSLAASCAALLVAACNAGTSSSGITTASVTNGSTGGKAGTGGPDTSGSGTGGAASSSGGTTGSALGEACTFDPVTGTDSCTAEGYVCSADSCIEVGLGCSESVSGSGTGIWIGICILPTVGEVCHPSVGCQDGGLRDGGSVVCSHGFQKGGVAEDLCQYPCATTKDCLVLDTDYACIPVIGGPSAKVCWFNVCNLLDPPNYAPCPVLDAGDGECLPLSGGEAVCFLNGSARLGAPCSPYRSQGTDSECGYGDFCEPTDAQDGGLCFGITVDGICPDAGLLAFQPIDVADWKICVQDCSEGQICLLGTCKMLPDGTTYVCLP